MRIASLPWYDFAETRPHHDAFWSIVRDQLIAVGVDAVPETLCRSGRVREDWNDPGLLLSQACGYDLLLRNPPPLRLVATPAFEFAGCSGPNYTSHIVTRSALGATTLSDLQGLRCVINGPASHSGMNGLRAMTRARTDGRFFSSVVVTDSHEASLGRIQRGEADVASIDCITYGLLQRYRPSALEGIARVEQTAPAAAPPFVTHATTSGADAEHLRDALAHAASGPSGRALGLRGVVDLSLEDYEPIAELAQRGVAATDDEYQGEPLADRWGGTAHPSVMAARA